MSVRLRPSQVADAAGVNVQTLRYYEGRGLLAKPPRSLGGHREYDHGVITTLRVIRGLQRLGFTLTQIHELVGVGTHRGPRPGLREAAQAKLAEVDANIANLRRVRRTLADVLSADCTDLEACSSSVACPMPFADLEPAATNR